MTGKIEIILKSDLCAASGDGFSSVIDTDVSYDRYGFPVIGGRRLKGCLKKTAELIGSDKKDEIFGVSGSDSTGSLKISNAVIENFIELANEADGLSPEKVISLFSYVKASTAIENDTAKDNSLRYTRVVKHYSPLDKSELKFYADVEIADEYSKEFSDICRGLKNIGYKRNRGFGAVSCRFVEDSESDIKNGVFNIIEENCGYSYTVLLKDNLMLPGMTSDETIDYIPGSSVLGYLAGKYKEKYGKDDRFDEIFLKNNVRFSNLYISDKDGNGYFPIPVILGKVKGKKEVINITDYPKDDIVKPLKSGYCNFECVINKPLTEITYHHSTGKDATLYTQTSLCCGQYFSGEITGRTEYVKLMKELLEESGIRFGRSKTAQYSSCELVRGAAIKPCSEYLELKKGDRFIAFLLSDILIPDGIGGYDISIDGLKKILGFENCELDKDQKRKCSALRYKVISGYNSKWNIQKPHIRTIGAGSALVFTAESDMKLSHEGYYGAKQNEGFGKVMFCRPADFRETSIKQNNSDTESKASGLLTELIRSEHNIENMRIKALNFAKTADKSVGPTQLGRFILMTKNAADLDELLSWTNNIEYFTNLIINSGAAEYKDDLWRDYLTLILTVIKYVKRGESNE